MNISLQTAQNPYCLGIGGIGVSAIARYFVSTGRLVRGTDRSDTPITEALRKLGVQIEINSNAVPSETDLVVYSDAIPATDPVLQAARQKGVFCINFAQALSKLIDMYPERLVVAGTNGKTTTTAWAGWLCQLGGLDPTVVVGSLVSQWQSNYVAGHGSLAIAEGDEYLGHFFHLHPTRAVITNIEFDHPDYFQNLRDVKNHFEKFLSFIPDSGVIYANGDDPILRALCQKRNNVLFFSLKDPTSALWLEPLELELGARRIRLYYRGHVLGETVVHLPGRYNLANAAGAALVALDLGVPSAKVLDGIASFEGTWRRFEIVKKKLGAIIVSDYAHHPTAVRAVIDAAKEWFPGQTLVVIFQAHHRSRFRSLENEFIDALGGADRLLISEIYSVPGREKPEDQSLTAATLVHVLQNQKKNASFFATRQALFNELEKYYRPNHVLLFLGAGDIDQVARQL